MQTDKKVLEKFWKSTNLFKSGLSLIYSFFFIIVHRKTYRSLSSISNDTSSTSQAHLENDYYNNTTSSALSSSLCEKVEQISVQSEWLKQNQKILASLYEHCLMVGTRDPELPGTLCFHRKYCLFCLAKREQSLKVCHRKILLKLFG